LACWGFGEVVATGMFVVDVIDDCSTVNPI